MVPISLSGLVIALAFVGLILAISRLLGLVLVWIFSWNHPGITGAVFGMQVVFATQAVRERLRGVPVAVGRPVLLAVAGGGLLVTILTTAAVLQVEPFWTARFWIPIAGMVLGHAMNGIAVAVERLFADLDNRTAEVRTLLALGATPGEARLPAVRYQVVVLLMVAAASALGSTAAVLGCGRRASDEDGALREFGGR